MNIIYTVANWIMIVFAGIFKTLWYWYIDFIYVIDDINVFIIKNKM